MRDHVLRFTFYVLRFTHHVSETTMSTHCSNCGNALLDGAAFCDNCGAPVRGQGQGQPAGQPTVYNSTFDPAQPSAAPQQGASGAGAVNCPVCGAPAMPGEAFCDNCGGA